MRILVTRPQNESKTLEALLRDIGLKPELAPMLAIERLPVPPLSQKPSIILLTSQNAVFSLELLSLDPTTQILAVGDQTAHKAKELGFTNVKSLSGSAQNLLNHIQANFTPECGLIVHLAAEEVKVDIARTLSQKGFLCEKVPVYKTTPIRIFPEHIGIALRQGHIKNATFLSQKTSKVFLETVKFAKIDESVIKAMNVYCFSDDVAQPFEKLGVKNVFVSPAPNMKAFISMIENNFIKSGK